MARFPEHFIYQVQQATDIVDLISRYVALKKKGREFLGLCPFHQDKNPSMFVSPTKQIFKCFACGAGGTVFNFVMMYEKATFPEAVRSLAEQANIPLPTEVETSHAPKGLGKSDLSKLTEFAADFFFEQLQSKNGAAALDYARKRGFTDESIKRFRIGYAPEAWEALMQKARRNGWSEEQLVAAGLVIRRERGGCYDRFRNRLMFPICDVGGRVIAFGGRALSANDRAKYLNSPESILFDKSRQLFALNWSREGIVSSSQAIVVEGYLDALIPLQAGFSNVVATLGTSLTERHVNMLSRYASEVVLIFDADVAGAAASERALELFLTQQVQVRVATIPAGKDPCDFCLGEGPEALKQLIAGAPDALEYAWKKRLAELKQAGENLADRRRVVEDFLRLVVTSSTYGSIDEIRRGQLAQHIGHILNVPQTDLQQMMRRLGRRTRPVSRSAGVDAESRPSPREGLETLAERHILESVLCEPELFDKAAERVDPADFQSPQFRRIAEALWRLGLQGRGDLDNLMSCEDLAEDGALLAELATDGEQRGSHDASLTGALDALQYRRERTELEKKKAGGVDSDETLRIIQRRALTDVYRRPKIQ